MANKNQQNPSFWLFNGIIPLLIWILIFVLVGSLMGQLTAANMNQWYPGLHKSMLTPPDIVFSIVWTILYIVLAIVGWSLWMDRHKETSMYLLSLFSIQMLLNWAWTPLFFAFHWIGWALLDLTAMVLLCLLMIIQSMRELPFTAWLLTPYFVWLCFALYLNAVIWLLN